MKIILLAILLPLYSYGQNTTNVGAYGGMDKSGNYFAGVQYEWLEDQYDAYAGYIGKVVVYDSTALILAGWKLQGIDTFQPYAGLTLGISTSKDAWFAYEIYGGFTFDWNVAPFFEVAYGSTLLKTGIKIKLWD